MDSTVPELVRCALKGDEAAFERLYRLHSQRVYGLCLRMTTNQAEAEDLTQEVFMQAFRKLATFRGEAAFSTWIYRVARNVVLMKLRKKPLPEVSLDQPATPGGAPLRVVKAPRYADPTPNLEDRLRLQKAFGQLPRGYRKVVVLHDIQGYDHNEIARMTGRSVGNSKSQLHKARQRLREILTA